MFMMAAAPFVDLFQDARDEVRIASPSVFDTRVIRAIGVGTSHGARATVILAPTAAVSRVENHVYVGTDPYAVAEPEFTALKKVKADIFIDPRFSNAGSTDARVGRSSTMSFAVLGSAVVANGNSVVCTGAMSAEAMASQRNVCVKITDSRVHTALRDLHRSDSDDLADPGARKTLEARAREALVISPGASAAVSGLFAGCNSVRVVTSEIDLSGELGKAVLNCGPKVTLTLPPSYRPKASVLAALKNKRVIVEVAPSDFSGSMVVSNNKVFVGSQSFTEDSMEKARNVGVVFAAGEVDSFTVLGGAK
jgi:hypothetical protein